MARRYNTRNIQFPIKRINSRGEQITISKYSTSKGYGFQLNVNNYQFNYATNDFFDCLKYAGLSLEEVKYGLSANF